MDKKYQKYKAKYEDLKHYILDLDFFALLEAGEQKDQLDAVIRRKLDGLVEDLKAKGVIQKWATRSPCSLQTSMAAFSISPAVRGVGAMRKEDDDGRKNRLSSSIELLKGMQEDIKEFAAEWKTQMKLRQGLMTTLEQTQAQIIKAERDKMTLRKGQESLAVEIHERVIEAETTLKQTAPEVSKETIEETIQQAVGDRLKASEDRNIVLSQKLTAATKKLLDYQNKIGHYRAKLKEAEELVEWQEQEQQGLLDQIAQYQAVLANIEKGCMSTRSTEQDGWLLDQLKEIRRSVKSVAIGGRKSVQGQSLMGLEKLIEDFK